MRIALIHNVRAGARSYSRDDISRLLQDAGHDVDIFTKSGAELERAVTARYDVLVVSGGDGTVAQVAIALCGGDVPLYILPTGTANNIARAVGAEAAPPLLVARLETARLTRLDVGRVADEGHETSFVEAAGIGFIGAMLEEDRRRLLRLARTLNRLPRDPWVRMARGVARRVRRQPARRIALVADGEDLSGEYIAVEVMNILAIGPRIRLATSADPGDGWFDLALVRPGDRETLAAFIETAPPDETPPIEVRRVRRVDVEWPPEDTHVDDEPWPPVDRAERPLRVTIAMQGAAPLLVPDWPVRDA